MINTLESKINDLDKLITEKVGKAFVKRSQMRQKKQQVVPKVSGYFEKEGVKLAAKTELTPIEKKPTKPIEHQGSHTLEPS